MTPIDGFLFGGALLLILSVLASKATGRIGVPSLLVFLLVGILAGSEGLVGIEFDNAYYAQIIGIIALSYILFSGGLDTDWKSIRPVLRPGILLSTVGVLLTCGLTGWFVHTVLDFSWIEGLLIGAIVSSTDAAAVFSVLRTKSVNLKGELRPVLELESGSNDPMAIFLTTALLSLLQIQNTSGVSLVPTFFQQMILGGAVGVAAGRFAPFLLNKIKLEYEGLYPVLTLALVLLIYTGAQTIGGNGFLSVYLAGVLMGNQNFLHKKSLVLFHDGIAWIMQITMFLTLGLLVYPSQLLPVAGAGLLISIFLMFVARPVGVHASLVFSGLNWREKGLISWVGLRGAVPIVLATYPLVAGVERAGMIFHLVFFVVITSVLLQGSTIPLVARILKVDAPVKPKFRYPIEYVPTDNMKGDLIEIPVAKNSEVIGKSIVDLNLPKDALIVLIQRKGSVIVPRGGTVIEKDDTLLVLAESGPMKEIRKLVS